MNEFEESGRSEKAAAIVEQVEFRFAAENLDPCADAEEIASRLRAWDEATWTEIQHAAGYRRKKPPSSKTRDLVIWTFERRVDQAGESEP